MKTHELKTWPNAFAGLKTGQKTHEVRKWDRDYDVGDRLRLQEWRPDPNDNTVGEYTGEELWFVVTWISDPSTYGMTSDLVVMSVRQIPSPYYTDEEGPPVPHDHRD